MTATADSPQFQVTVHSDWLDAWIVVKGCLDRLAVQELDRAIEEALESRPRKVHLVVAEVSSMDASAVRALDAAGGKARSRGCRLVMHRPRRSVRVFLEASSLRNVRISNRLALG